MKKKTLKRLCSHLSSFDYVVKCLKTLDTHDWKICIVRNGSLEEFHNKTVFSVNDECKIDYFYFNKKMFKKDFYLVSSTDYDPNIYECIKSNQLTKKLERYVKSWRLSLEERFLREYEHYTKTPKFLQSEYEAQCLTAEDKSYIKKLKISLKKMPKTNFEEERQSINIKHEKLPKKSKRESEDIIMTKEELKQKMLKIKNKYIVIGVGSIWTDEHYSVNTSNEEVSTVDFSKVEKQFWDSHLNSEVSKPETNLDESEVSESLEEFKAKHCACCRHHFDYKDESTQHDIDTKNQMIQTKVSTSDNVSQTTQMSTSIQTQTEEISQSTILNTIDAEDDTTNKNISKVNESVKNGNSKLNLKFDNIMSDSTLLGEPHAKRSRELASVYNELNSIIGKMSKVAGRRKITTPSTSYLSYHFFEQLLPDIQEDIIKNYRELIKQYRFLRSKLIETLQTESFTADMTELMLKIQNRIMLMNHNLHILSENQQTEVDVLTTECDDELKDTKTVIHGVIGDYNLTCTPQEGNSQSVLTFDDSMISSLLS